MAGALLAGLFLLLCSLGSSDLLHNDVLAPDVDSAQTSGNAILRQPVGLLPSQTWISEADVNASSLTRSIVSAVEYLQSHCDKTGKFLYVTSLDPSVDLTDLSNQYNWLRHAGVIYSLAMAYKWDSKPFSTDLVHVMVRAADFLKSNALGPVTASSDGEMLGVWSRPEMTHNVRRPCVKLGGVALSLVALISLEEVSPGATSLAVLQALSRFIVMMQRSDGSFHSKFPNSTEGQFVSLYYPGEAALALLMMYEKDGNEQWLHSAAKALTFLARSRKMQTKVSADHWALLATAKLLPLLQASKKSAMVSREDILPAREYVAHAVKICHSMIDDADQVQTSLLDKAATQGSPSVLTGSLYHGGVVTPTSIRVEGLMASLSFLPDSEAEMRQHIQKLVRGAVAFLMRAQIRDPSSPVDGAFPAALPCDPNRAANCIVRMDFPQHALSGLIQYHQGTFS